MRDVIRVLGFIVCSCFITLVYVNTDRIHGAFELGRRYSTAVHATIRSPLLRIFTPEPVSTTSGSTVGTTEDLIEADTEASRSPTTSGALKNPRIFAFIHTTTANHATRAKAVEDTWAKHLDGHAFSTISDDPKLTPRWVFRYEDEFIKADNRQRLWQRVKGAFEKINNEIVNDYDWFLKTDDDTFVVVENLRALLAEYNSSDPWYMAEMVNLYRGGEGYPQGGAYVLSREAVKRWVSRFSDPDLCSNFALEMEDVEIGKCLARSGVQKIKSVDQKGEHRMVPINLADVYPKYRSEPETNYVKWWLGHAEEPVRKGPSCCSSNLISIHYLKPEELYVYDYLLYKVKISS